MKLDQSPLYSHLPSSARSCRFSASTLRFGFGKGLARCQQDSVVFRVSFPSSDNAIDIDRIELDEVAAPPGLVGGNQAGPASAEGIKNDATAFRHILDGVGNHGDRLHRRMERKLIRPT